MRRRVRTSTKRRIGTRAREARFRFLTNATTALVSSLDFEATLDAVAHLAVPMLADGCVIDLVEGSEIRRVSSVHRDPAKRASAEALRSLGAPPGDAPVHRIVSMDAPALAAKMTDDDLVKSARDATHLEILRELAPRSGMILPLRARGRTTGVLWLYSSEPDKAYGPSDLALAGELGARIGLALDNARLFREAQDAVRMRDEFLAIASHELRTPLTPLKLQIGRLLRQSTDPDVREKLALADRQVDRMTALIAQLLDVSRIASGRLSLDTQEVDLVEIVRLCVDAAAIEARRKGSALRVDSEDAVLGTWDAARLEQVVLNLLSNAIKYGEGKPIDVRVTSDAEHACVEVRDHGIGIAAENQARIFERFERAVSARHFGGFGLGLWIVRQIVEASGGSILVESEHGRGSRFVVKLPRTHS